MDTLDQISKILLSYEKSKHIIRLSNDYGLIDHNTLEKLAIIRDLRLKALGLSIEPDELPEE